MGSISNSLTGSTAADTSGSGAAGSITFSGTSTYSKDFQNVISRAVAIASLPINLLATQEAAVNHQSTELATLDTKVTSLQTALQGIGDALGGAAFQSQVSNPSVAGVSLADGATEGVYSIHVTSIGSYATSLTA